MVQADTKGTINILFVGISKAYLFRSIHSGMNDFSWFLYVTYNILKRTSGRIAL